MQRSLLCKQAARCSRRRRSGRMEGPKRKSCNHMEAIGQQFTQRPETHQSAKRPNCLHTNTCTKSSHTAPTLDFSLTCRWYLPSLAKSQLHLLLVPSASPTLFLPLPPSLSLRAFVSLHPSPLKPRTLPLSLFFLPLSSLQSQGRSASLSLSRSLFSLGSCRDSSSVGLNRAAHGCFRIKKKKIA